MYSLIAIFILVIIASLASCTENKRARSFGGSQTIELPKGERLTIATWKESNLWYLTEPMEADYTPKIKYFRESSSMGVWEGTVKFVESR